MVSWSVSAGAQQSLESAYRTTGAAVVAAFEVQRKVLQTSSAVIVSARKEVAYGVVISADGHILTKASEVMGVNALGAIVNETKYSDAKIVVVDPTWDVALLKVEASNLIPVNFAPTSDVPVGTWVVANGDTTRTARRLLAGIISAKSREIPASGGAALGVVLEPKVKRVELAEVNEKGGAFAAGLVKGDVILTIDGIKVASIADVSEILKERKAGATVKLAYRRAGKEIVVDVRLTVRSELFDDQMSRNDEMSGRFSNRRSGFPRVIQHDILGSKDVEGGPLLDLDGRCLGMNIARANRAENYAIPVEDLREIALRLMKKSADGR